jgi:hypothetical protein
MTFSDDLHEKFFDKNHSNDAHRRVFYANTPRVRLEVQSLRPTRPGGREYAYPCNSAPFIASDPS